MKIKILVLVALFALLGIERAFKISEWFWLNYVLLGVSIVSLIPEVFKLIKDLADRKLKDEPKKG